MSEMIAPRMRLAMRALLRTPGFTVTAVLSLALAIGASAAAFAVIDAVRFRALPFPDGDRLVLLSEVPVDDNASAGARAARISSVEIQQPDLEAVFLQLTGRGLRD